MPRKSYKSVLWDHSGSGAGAHRLQAAVDLGWDWIDVVFHDDWSEIDRQLWEIDENLMRAELSPVEMSEHLARRKELWGKRNSGNTVPENRPRGRPAGFASETAEATGVTKRAVNKAIARTEAIPGDIRAIIKGTKLDTGTYLDSLKGMDPDEQRAQDSLNSTDCLCRLDSLPSVRPLISHWCRPEPCHRYLLTWGGTFLSQPMIRRALLSAPQTPVSAPGSDSLKTRGRTLWAP